MKIKENIQPRSQGFCRFLIGAVVCQSKRKKCRALEQGWENTMFGYTMSIGGVCPCCRKFELLTFSTVWNSQLPVHGERETEQ